MLTCVENRGSFYNDQKLVGTRIIPPPTTRRKEIRNEKYATANVGCVVRDRPGLAGDRREEPVERGGGAGASRIVHRSAPAAAHDRDSLDKQAAGRRRCASARRGNGPLGRAAVPIPQITHALNSDSKTAGAEAGGASAPVCRFSNLKSEIS